MGPLCIPHEAHVMSMIAKYGICNKCHAYKIAVLNTGWLRQSFNNFLLFYLKMSSQTPAQLNKLQKVNACTLKSEYIKWTLNFQFDIACRTFPLWAGFVVSSRFLFVIIFVIWIFKSLPFFFWKGLFLHKSFERPVHLPSGTSLSPFLFISFSVTFIISSLLPFISFLPFPSFPFVYLLYPSFFFLYCFLYFSLPFHSLLPRFLILAYVLFVFSLSDFFYGGALFEY